MANKTIACEHCELPVCRQCHEDLTQAKLPRLSYANEMFTGYGLKRIYKDKVTAMELVCASPALTSMILMSMESRHRNQSKTSAFDEQAHMARHRYGARGNVITFPLPTDEILRALDDFMESNGPADSLPRSGKQLADVVRVILRTNKDGHTSEHEIKTLIHQANVRRQAAGVSSEKLFCSCLYIGWGAVTRAQRCQVVVDLILDMKRLGHPAFTSLQEETVRANAAALPEDGIPPEVLQIINEVDDGANKLQPQKAATPADGMHANIAAAGPNASFPALVNRRLARSSAPGAAFSTQRPRAVVAEGHSLHQAHEVQAAAIDELKENMTSEAERGAFGVHPLEIRTGNKLLDQFDTCYWCIAFCFLFPYATAGPDVQKLAGGLAAWRRLIGPYIAHFFGFHARRRSYTKTGICSINLILRPCAFEDDGTAKISKRKACHPEAPEVGVEAWGAAMQRQVASQFRRDWNFPPTLWNYLFRTKINLQQNSHIFSVPNEFGPGRRMLTNEEIQEGTEHIYQLLRCGKLLGCTWT